MAGNASSWIMDETTQTPGQLLLTGDLGRAVTSGFGAWSMGHCLSPMSVRFFLLFLGGTGLLHDVIAAQLSSFWVWDAGWCVPKLHQL